MIRGIVAAVPKHTVTNTDKRFVATTGVAERRVVLSGDDVLTLAARAVDRLLEGLHWDVSSIGAIIFVTQTPTIRMPAMAQVLAGEIGYGGPAFDVNLACSGYVYGLWLATHLRQMVGAGVPGKRVLLVTGDVTSPMTVESEPGTRNLFGDCVAATCIDNEDGYYDNFNLGTDGSGAMKLVGDPQIKMDGPEVFSFALKAVPQLVADTTMNAHVDWFLMHQANGLMLSRIGKKCKIPPEKMPMNIGKYGNTSSASIPLLMADSECTEALRTKKNRCALFGFGAGWSWGGVMLDVGPLEVLEVVEV